MKYRIRYKSKSLVVNIIIIVIITIFLFCSCTTFLKNGTSSFSIEKAFETSVYGMGLALETGHSGPWELGITFQPKRECKIIGIRIKNPELGEKRLSFWDAESRELLSSYDLTIYDATNYNYFHIEIPLQKDKEYTLSINCNDYYYRQLPFDQLPLQNENITLLHSVFIAGSWQQYPINQENSLVHGLIDIDVQYKIN